MHLQYALGRVIIPQRPKTAEEQRNLSDSSRLPYTVKGSAIKTVQLPDEIYDQAAKLAESDHVSVDRLVAALVSEGVGDWSNVQARATRGSVAKLKCALSKVSDAAPDEMDRL